MIVYILGAQHVYVYTLQWCNYYIITSNMVN